MSSSINYQRKQAFIIGINDYLFSSLTYCINDAQEFKKTLENIGFNVALNVNLNLKVFNQVFDAFLVDIKPTDIVLFYFAGHAEQYQHENYLLLSNQTKCMNANEVYSESKLLPIKAPLKTLVAYTNCQYQVVCDETGNGKNSYFMENLLKYITISNMDITYLLRKVDRDIRIQTNGSKSLCFDSDLKQKVFLAKNNVKHINVAVAGEVPSTATSTEPIVSSPNRKKHEDLKRKEDIDLSERKFASENDSSSYKDSQRKQPFVTNTSNSWTKSKAKENSSDHMTKDVESNILSTRNQYDLLELLELQGACSGFAKTPSHLSNQYKIPIELKTPKTYPSKIFGNHAAISPSLQSLLQNLRYYLKPMDKQGPMSGRCIRETNVMQNFLHTNFGFRNIDGAWIVPSVKAFKLDRLPSTMNDNKKICFPIDYPCSFTMTISEIKHWQKSFVVYADRYIPGMEKSFLYRALQGGSMNGNEAFRMKFVVRISDCPILMKFDAVTLRRSLNEDWPHRIKLVSVTGVDFAGRIHDVDDITSYITNWIEIYQLDLVTRKMIVFDNRDFHPVHNHPNPILDKNRLFNDLKRMVKLRLKACDQEKIQIVVETGIGLGIFSGKNIGIDGDVRMLSARAMRCILEEQGASYKHIQAIVITLPIFSKIVDGYQIPDVYHGFVKEFYDKGYSGPIPVLIIDQDMHELAVFIAKHGFRVSELNPADSHGVFGEYWQNYGPAVEEKLALTTLGLLTQHHLINPSVLDTTRYNLI